MPDWLTAGGRRAVRRRQLEWAAGDRIRYDEHLAWWRRSRYLNHGQRSLELVAADHGAAFLAPFSESRVLHALALDRKGTGFASRTDAMRYLFGDVLPEGTLGRRSKASFSNPLVGPVTREFARGAEPSGVVSEDLVEVDALRAAWQADVVDIRSLPALQACWLAANTSDPHRMEHSP
jgi:hypothetical protein